MQPLFTAVLQYFAPHTLSVNISPPPSLPFLK